MTADALAGLRDDLEAALDKIISNTFVPAIRDGARAAQERKVKLATSAAIARVLAFAAEQCESATVFDFEPGAVSWDFANGSQKTRQHIAAQLRALATAARGAT